MTFKADDGGRYLVIFPKIFSEGGYKLLSTDHSFAGSIVVSINTPLYAHFKVDTNGKYKTTVCRGGYDDKGGSPVSTVSGTIKKRIGRVRIWFGDNYGGTKASLVITEAKVCVEKPAAAAVPPKPPTPAPAPTPTPAPAPTPTTTRTIEWHAREVCAENEGPEYRWRWLVTLKQSGTAVTGNISFHKCPGEGRAAYRLTGKVEADGSFTVTGSKSGGRGSLYSSTRRETNLHLAGRKGTDPEFFRRRGGTINRTGACIRFHVGWSWLLSCWPIYGFADKRKPLPVNPSSPK